MNQSIRFNRRCQQQAYAERPELNRDYGSSLRAGSGIRNYRERKFSSGKETGFASADRNEIGFGENLQKILVLKQTQRRSEIKIGPEGKQVQQVTYADSFVAQLLLAVGSLGELQLADSRKLELLRCCRADESVIDAEEVYPELAESRAVHRSELHLQHHLPVIRRRRLNQVHNRLRVAGGDRSGLLGDLRIAHNTREKKGIFAARDFDLLAGEGRPQLLLNFSQIRFDGDVIRRHVVAVPNHDCRVSRSLAVQHNVVGRDDNRICDRRVGYRDARSIIGKLQQLAAADRQRHGTRRKRRCQPGRLRRLGRLARFLDSEINRRDGLCCKFIDLVIQSIAQHELDASSLLGQDHLLSFFLTDQ